MIKNSTLLFTSLLILFSACGESSINSEKELLEKEEKRENIVPKEHEKPKTTDDLLKSMGFDFNKTSHFFEQIEIEMHGKAEEIERKITNAEINFTKDIGIELTGDKIGIDLNKTRNMLQEINILLKDIVLDINHSVH